MLKNDCADFCSQPEAKSQSDLSEPSGNDGISGTQKVYKCSDVLVRGSRSAMASMLGILGKSVLCVLNKVENVPAMLVKCIDGSEFIEFTCPADRLAELVKCDVIELVTTTEKFGVTLLHTSPFRPNLCRLPRRVIQEKQREMEEGSKDNSDGGHENNLVKNPPLAKLDIVTMLKQLNYLTANELSDLFGISVNDIISLAEREGVNLYSVDIANTSIEDFVVCNSDKTVLEIAELLMAKPSSIQIVADSLKIELPEVPDITDLNDKAVDLIKTLAFMPFMTMEKVAKILGTSYSKAIQFVSENHLCLCKTLDVKSKYGNNEKEFYAYLEQNGVDALNKDSINTNIIDSNDSSSFDADFFVVVKDAANGSYQWSDAQLKYILDMKDKKLEEIANLFGVSKATVSRVFSKKLGMKKQCK